MKREYEVQIWLLDAKPQIWKYHYRGDLGMCTALFEGLVRSGSAARLVRISDGEILKEWRP